MNLFESHGRGIFHLFLHTSLIIILFIGTTFSQHYVPNFDTDALGNSIAIGEFIAEQYASWGMHIAQSDTNHKAMAFGSESPTGGDTDLGTPNEAFNATGGVLWDGSSPRGTGIGAGGAAGQPGENRWPLGNVLVLSTDNNQSIPNDYAGGGSIIFTFDTPAIIIATAVLDDLAGGDYIRAWDASNNLLYELEINNPGENSFQEIPVNVSNISKLEIDLSGSGAVPYIRFQYPNPIDWGDAPDLGLGNGAGDYYTLSADDGPNHSIDTNLKLGSLIDDETAGQPTTQANGDDLNGTIPDDEDGINPFELTLLERTFPQINVNVTNETGQAATVSGWIDYDGDGLFETSERATTTANSSGTVSLNFPQIPQGSASASYARFRISTNESQVILPTGNASDGEVEDYAVTIQENPEYDFGDAPDPNYPTLSSSSGAKHLIVPGYYMGSTIDADADGQPNVALLGDDNDGIDDEDGVSFTSPLMQFYQNSVNVTVSGSGFINAWMDFNRDGDWDDPDEHIITDQAVSTGSNNIFFQVPLIDDTGENRNIGIASRFRFCTQQGLSYDGLAPNGEVEDYQIDVLVPVELSSFQARSINGIVELEWSTASETENMGFDVLRSELKNGDYVKITPNVITGAGNSSNRRNYRFTDKSVSAGQTYYYQLVDYGINGSIKRHDPIKLTIDLPIDYELQQNYPNPFNPNTRIKYSIQEAGHVHLIIFNLNGQQIKTLVNNNEQSGSHQVIWDGRNDQGVQVPSGTYLYKLKVNGFEQIRKMVFTK